MNLIKQTQIHRLISGTEEGRGLGRIPDHQEGVRCKLSLRNPAIGDAEKRTLVRLRWEGNAADDALMVDQGKIPNVDNPCQSE